MEAGEFLIELWGNPPPGQVLVWTLPQKRSIWYNRLDNVEVGVISHLDVYTGVGVAPLDVMLRTGQRATADGIGGLAGLWADVDYAGKDHSKPNLPLTEADAWGLVHEMPVPPTILVHTGHGLQAWWLFHEPWIFEDGEREEAQAMIRGWQGHMAQLAGNRGWVVDATHDLARLMRLPGTYNNKSERVPVKVLSSDGPRLDRNMVWEYIAAGIEDVQIFQKVAVEGIVLDPDAQAPTTKFWALTENDPKFKKSWQRRRTDLPDQSASSYDMSLASIAVTAGWSDQEVVNLLIAHRRDNGDDLKLDHTGFSGYPSYYAGTIAKARGPNKTAAAQERQAAAQERLEDGGTLEDLSVLLGVEILDLVMHVGDPPEFWMETPRGGITLGKATNITDQRRFRDAVYGTTGQYILKCKEALWKPRAEAIHACCRVVELGEASHPGSEMGHWVETYLDTQTILEDKNTAAEQGLPFRKDGVVMFTLSGFRQYLRFSMGESLSSHRLGQRLRLCGVTPTVVRVAIRGKETSRNYWERKDG
jgi:hypothetical protein